MTAVTQSVVIVGGGLAGLSCAKRLWEEGVPSLILEASDDIGGRVRTDRLDGFLLDRGFQVLLTAYPETQRQLDYGALELRPFLPGALVRMAGRFHRVVDPWRRPIDALRHALAPIGSVADKVRVARLRYRVLRGTLDGLWSRPERTTRAALVEEGFSERMIDRFFRPFFGGVLLDPDLETSSRMFEFTFRMFALGDSAVPAAGIGAIPHQLAGALPVDFITTQARVTQIDADGVRTADGRGIGARAIVIASEGPEAARLLGQPAPRPARACTCVYFAADRPPIDEAMLMLNAEGSGPVNNLAVMSQVAPSYAPAGAVLLAATVLGVPASDDQLMPLVRQQLRSWFGPTVDGWRHLRTYRIPYAQPDQEAPALDPVSRPVRVRPGLYVCGDHRETASIHGAMRSGRRAAEACLEDLS
jgi:phytoene dehydrogenase-like protein